MKTLIIFLTTILLGISLISHSQSANGKVKGAVIDGDTKTIKSATIVLLKAKDSTIIRMGVADETGKFSFDDVPDGKYLVSVSAVGHQNGFSETFEVNGSHSIVNLKTIELVKQEKSLATVVIVTKKPLIEQKIDRTIVNVDASVTNVGNSALEVLEKAPGISVDKDGNISLKGKSGVQIYIDGRPSYLGGADLANLLRSMSSSQLEQIEIMTNPPAKYDAAGNSGVINIKTKKNKQFGYNGSLTSGYTQGIYARFNESLNFNFRTSKVNLFSNLNFSHNDRRQILEVNRNFRDANTKDLLSEFVQTSTMKTSNTFYSAKIGLDYFATKKTTLGIVVNGYSNPSLWRSTTPSFIYDPTGTLISQTKAFSENNQKWKNFSSNLNFRTVFDSTGQEISGDLDYIQYRTTATQPLISWYYDNTGNLLKPQDTLMGNLPQDITIYSGKIDYVLPLKRGAKLEAGIKSSYVKTDNDAEYDSLQNGQVVHDTNRSNHFVYEENINAAYVNYTKPLSKKWTGQFGLRLENTNAKGNQLTTGQKFTRKYTQLFPTAFLQYVADEKNQFVVNYGRRVNRPNYEDLNPFIHFLDRYTFEQGNPDLAPQFSHNIELTHTYNGFLSTTLNYSSTKDIIQQVFEQNTVTKETYIRKANIASMHQFGIALSANKQVTKWWSGNVYVNVFNNRIKGIVNNDYVSVGVTAMLVQLQQQFKWGKGWGAELSGMYLSNALEGVIFINPLTQINAGFSKQVLKNKGTLRLGFRDIFKGMNVKGYSKYGNVDIQFRNAQDSRSVSLSFTWRFNKGKLKANAGRKEGGASEEQNRVKAGGN